jgi:preprotein translocase subunit SecE
LNLLDLDVMTGTMGDNVKFAGAVLLVVAGLVGYYVMAEQATVLRVLVVLAGVALAAALAWRTEPGQRFFEFGREAVVEAKKVAWPSRRETLQMTGVVFLFVLAMAIMLWLTDKTLEWVLYDLLLGWKK